jgi:hypothetical protein
MRITKRQLRRIIKEMLDVDYPADVEAKEDVWAGCEDAGNLELDIDFAKAVGAEEVTKGPESLPRQESMLDERRLRRIIRKTVARSN